jgi:hypothetical protein
MSSPVFLSTLAASSRLSGLEPGVVVLVALDHGQILLICPAEKLQTRKGRENHMKNYMKEKDRHHELPCGMNEYTGSTALNIPVLSQVK